ncbi:MAG: hypothetical protein K5912_04035 [Alphaproteobacteria bacterium]|nr:hypothetical protein [Alphaproteobacteria bacterium]
MLTKVDLCSMALVKIGENPIQSLNENTAAAKLGRMLIDSVTDVLLAMHPWNFASKTYSLVRNSDNEFIIPSEVLRIIKTEGRIQGKKIISNQDTVSIEAIIRVQPSDFPEFFSSLLVTKLAMEFCMSLLGDQTLFRTLVSLYETELQNAKFLDSTMSAVTGIESFDLINTRF